MNEHSDSGDSSNSLRDKIIGLGERSVRKSYYPQLRQQLEEAQESRSRLQERSEALLNMLEDLEEARTNLSASEARYRSLVENISDVIFSLSSDGTVLYASPVIHSLIGLTPEQVIGEPFTHLVHPDDQPALSGFESIPEGQTEQLELRMLAVDGVTHYVRASSRPLVVDGQVVGVTGVLSDITERKQAESELRQSEEKFSAAFWATPDMLAITRLRDGMMLEVNEGYERMLGYMRAESIGKTVFELGLWADAAGREEYLDRLRRFGVIRDFETSFCRKDGTLADVMISGRKFKLQGVDCILSVVRDITDRKLTEQALAAREREYRTLVESLPDLIVRYGPDLRRTYVNPAWEEAAGLSADGVVGVPVAESLNGADWYAGKILSVFETGEADDVEFEWDNAAGETLYLHYQLVPERDESGRVASVLAVGHDLTARRVAEEYRIAKQSAEAASTAKSAFLANMSHEIRTPMNAILGFSQLMRHDKGLSERQRQQLDIINSSGEHLLALVNDVLEMAKIEAGRITANLTAFDLHALLDEMESLFGLRAQTKGLVLRVARSDSVPRFVISDENKLRQVLVNLLGNAVKFTDEGSVELRVDAHHDEQARMRLVAEVQDTGRGIATQDMERLFSYFEQASVTHEAETGTGLGLAISREFVHLLGGEIGVESELGVGSTFRFEIEIELAQAESAQGGPEESRVVGLEAGQPRYRVLVADDAQDNRELLVQLLEQTGFAVRAACDGKEAVAIYKKWHPQLVLMDMRMPVMDGYEATRLIRSTPTGADVAIIAVTASAFAEMREGVFDAGVDEFVLKPFKEHELFDKIAALLGVRYVYEEHEQRDRETASVPSPAMLALLPDDLVERIRQAATSADFDEVVALAEEIAVLDEQSAKALRTLAERFDADAILDALPQGGVK